MVKNERTSYVDFNFFSLPSCTTEVQLCLLAYLCHLIQPDQVDHFTTSLYFFDFFFLGGIISWLITQLVFSPSTSFFHIS